MTATIDVAVAILIRADGRVLLAQRPAGKVYGGWWEFPGGKIEPGEGTAHALARELHEELGVEVERAYPWITRFFAYPHATVRLHFFRVLAWRGEPHGREGQAFAWQDLQALTVGPARVLGRAIAEPGLVEGAPADLVLFDRAARWTPDAASLLTRGWGGPLLGRPLAGRVLLTVADGRLAFEDAASA